MTKNILITGANKGLGLEVVYVLARQQPDATILLGTRSVSNGESALKDLKARGKGSFDNVQILQIDITSDKSVQSAAEEIKQKHGGKLDVLINNAGVMGDDKRQVIDVNYYGVKRTIDTLVPLIPKGSGKIVIVSSEVGAWSTHLLPETTQIRQTMEHPEKLHLDEVDGMVVNYLASQETNEHEDLKHDYAPAQDKWNTYGVSKALVSTYGRVLAREMRKEKDIGVVMVCPGFCKTELNGNRGFRKPIVGAKSIIAGITATQAQDGQLLQDGKALPIAMAQTSFEEMRKEAEEMNAQEKDD